MKNNCFLSATFPERNPSHGTTIPSLHALETSENQDFSYFSGRKERCQSHEMG